MGDYLSRFTFYDVVGYLLPGSVAMVAVALLASMLDPAWTFTAPSGIGPWGMLVAGSYFAGHVLQGTRSKVLRRSGARKSISKCTPDGRIAAAKKVLAEHGMQAESNAEVIDAVDQLKLPSPDQEIYVARQGFYRGSAAAFALMALVMLAAAVFGLGVSAFGVSLPRLASLLLGIAGVPLAGLFSQRYTDFVRYEIEFWIAAALRGTSQKSSDRH